MAVDVYVDPAYSEHNQNAAPQQREQWLGTAARIERQAVR